MPAYFDNPDRWRERAEEARAMADQMTDADTRRIMLSIAQGYDEMAERAEQRLASARR